MMIITKIFSYKLLVIESPDSYTLDRDIIKPINIQYTIFEY